MYRTIIPWTKTLSSKFHSWPRHRFSRGVNRGMEIRRSVVFFGPNPSIRRYFRSNPDPHYVKTYCGVGLLHEGKIDGFFLPLDALGERNVGVTFICKLVKTVNMINVNPIDIFSIFGRKTNE